LRDLGDLDCEHVIAIRYIKNLISFFGFL